MFMDSNSKIDIEAIKVVLETTDVFVVRFSYIHQRLLVDTRLGKDDMPMIRLVPPANSAEERYRYLRTTRPELELPTQITVFHWTQSIKMLRILGLWQVLEKRFFENAGLQAVNDAKQIYQEALKLEKIDIQLAISGGEGYETIWERYPFSLIRHNVIRRISAFFGIIIISLALAALLYFGQELVWGEAIRGTRREFSPDWRWLHVGELAIFWLLPVLWLNFYHGNWPNRFSTPVNVIVRTFITLIGAVAFYWVYYKTAHLFLGVQQGFSHPQQFPMIPIIWFICFMLINHWFMDNWPGWKMKPRGDDATEKAIEKARSDVRSTSSLRVGLIVGIVIGIVLYFGLIYALPTLGEWLTIYPK